jgi:hypothetical protein
LTLAGCGDTPPKKNAEQQKVTINPAALTRVQDVGSASSSGSGGIPIAKDAARGVEIESPSLLPERILRRESGPLAWPPFPAWGLKETSADALARIGAGAVPALAEALGDSSAQVRLQAARALARIGPDAAAAVPALTSALSDLDPLVRQNAARALGQIGPAAHDAVPSLMQALRSDAK